MTQVNLGFLMTSVCRSTIKVQTTLFFCREHLRLLQINVSAARMSSKLYLTLIVLGFTAVISRIKATVFDGGQDGTYQQDLIGADYTNNKLDEPAQEYQPPFYYNNNFDCTKHQYAYGMYADMDFQCQVYHVCHNNRKETFLCPQGTLFNQRLLVCDHWYSVNCRDTPSFYHVNQELGKVSNKTRFDSSYEPFSHRRLPEDYGQRPPHSPSYTTVRQEQQFPSSRDRSTQFPFVQSTTEVPVDNYRTRNQVSYPGRYYPQAPRDQTIDYGHHQIRSQFGQQNHQTLGHGYRSSGVNAQGPIGNRQQTYDYAQQKPESGSSGSQQSRFNQPGIGAPGTQQNRGLVFTHYSQSGGQRSSQGSKANNTWPFDRNEQKNETQGLHYGRQSPSPWKYGQNYPENAILGSRYNGQQGPLRVTPGSLYSRHHSTVSPDGQPQVLTSGVSYDNQQTFTTRSPNVQTHSFGRFPDHSQIPNLQHGQRQPEFGTSGFRHGRHDQILTQYGQQQPQSGSPRPPQASHHPFTSHGGQIHPQGRTPDSIIPSTGPRYAKTGPSAGEHGQLSAVQVRQGLHYKPPLGVQRNSTQIYDRQNPTTRFQVHQPQTSENSKRKPEFGYSGQSGHQVEGKPGSLRGTEQNASSSSEDKKQDSQFDNLSTSYNREPKTFQNPGSQQPWDFQGIRPYNVPRLNSQEQGSQRSHYGRQEPANTQGNQYSWQKPGSSQYSFQQPQYRNIHSSSNPAIPSQLTLSSSNDSSPGYSGVSNNFNALGQPRKNENRFWNYQSRRTWSVGRNSTGPLPIEAQSGGVQDTFSKGSQDKNLKPILVYQHHIPVTINGNTTNGSPNKTEGNRHQQVPVYKVYYVRGDQKDGRAN